MFKNRFILILAALSMLMVTLAVSRPFSKLPKTVDLSQPPSPVIVPVTGAEDQPYLMDSATRSYIAQGRAILAERNKTDSATQSYIAQGKAILAERNAVDSATQSYIAQGMAILAERNAVDSATQSYIAWGKALEAARKMGESGTCPTTSQEDTFAGIPDNLDSATRSYIARGLALQAKNNIGALCR
jgi:hypothetical protein